VKPARFTSQGRGTKTLSNAFSPSEYSMNRVFVAALFAATALLLPAISAGAAAPVQREPYGIGLEGFAYPYPAG
jgi:hypothetical protein